MPKVIHAIKSTINRSSDRVKHRSQKCNGHNSIRGVINPRTPLLLLPSLVVVAVFMAACITSNSNASATDISDTKSTTFSIEDEKSIGITLSSDNVVLNIQPTSSGVFNSTSMTVDVSTNNPTGYNLTMTASSTSLSRTAAINGTTPTIPTIPTDTTYTEQTFQNGYWGYKIGAAETNYFPMTTTPIPINTTDAAANSSVNTIVFASKLNNSTPAGTYSGITLSFIATTNPGLVYLQNVSSSTLAELMPNIGDTATLVDSRDEEEYLVGKLADGKYWMLENLRLGGDSSIELSSSDTNIANPFTLPATRAKASYEEGVITTLYENSTDGNGWKYGVFYNFCAASGGTICTESSSANASYDICPAGWTLPRDTHFSSLYSAYSSAYGTFISAFHIPISGYYSMSFTYTQGDKSARVWTGSYRNGNSMKVLEVGTSAVQVGYNGALGSPMRNSGFSIRCMLK